MIKILPTTECIKILPMTDNSVITELLFRDPPNNILSMTKFKKDGWSAKLVQTRFCKKIMSGTCKL